MPQLALIAALSENRVIGRENKLPWDLPKDWENFKAVTAGKPFIMGRSSYESPHGLYSDYKNVILSRRASLALPKAHFYHAQNISEALQYLKLEEIIFVLGGAQIFAQTINQATFLYLTIVHHEFEGDAYFPEIDWSQWSEIQSQRYEVDEQHAFPFSIKIYQRLAD